MGVGTRPCSVSPAAGKLVIVLGGGGAWPMEEGAKVFPTKPAGWPRFGMLGAMISFVKVGGSKELSVSGLGAGVEVTGGVEVTSFDICVTVVDGTEIEVGMVGLSIFPPIMGERVGGPMALARLGLTWADGADRRGDPGSIFGEPGEPGWGELVTPPAIRGTIFIPLFPLGAGGLPTPLYPPRGDIFCLDLGLGWPGMPAPDKFVLALVCETLGSSGAMARDIAVFPGGGPIGMLGRGPDMGILPPLAIGLLGLVRLFCSWTGG